MGAALVLVPNQLLQLLRFQATTEIWIRVLGILTITVGFYYFYTARHEQTAFYRATVHGRLFFFGAICLLTFVFSQPLTLLAIGSIDLLGAVWTWSALKK